MDGHSFDRIARLLGGASSRRAGIKAAVLAAVGLATRGVLPDDPAAAKPGQDGPCDDRSGKMNRCTVDGDCCTKYCKTGKSGKTGRCRCIHRGKPCRPEQKCCHGTCTNGKCPKKKRCVKPGGSCKTRTKKKKNGKKKKVKRTCCTGTCTNGKCPTSCKSNDESCTADAECCSGRCKANVCTVPCKDNDQSCTDNAECCGGWCKANVCTVAIPTGKACVAGDVCANPLAECTGYQSTKPVGTFCLLAQDEGDCTKDNDCITQVCTSGTCGAYVPGLAAVCGMSSADLTCKASSNATCQTYANSWQNTDSYQYFCTLDEGEACPLDIGDCACKSSACNSGTCCNTDTYTPNNKSCTQDSDCCSKLCQTVGTVKPTKYCLGGDQLWWQMNYTGSGDEVNMITFLSPDNTPYTYGTPYNSSDGSAGSYLPFVTSGGAHTFWNQTELPDEEATDLVTGPGNTGQPNGLGPDYCRESGGKKYTPLVIFRGTKKTAEEVVQIVANPRPNDKFRIMAIWDAQCTGDTYAIDGCGPNFTNLGAKGIWETGAEVKFFKGSSQVGSTVTIPGNPGGANPLHKYWWWIADVVYDDNNVPTIHEVNTFHECLPLPYELDGGTVVNNQRPLGYWIAQQGGAGYTNWCTPIPWVTGS